MSAPRPELRIVRGEPTPEELAALTAVVSAASDSGGAEAEPPLHGRWADPAWQHGRMPQHGPGAWASSYR